MDTSDHSVEDGESAVNAGADTDYDHMIHGEDFFETLVENGSDAIITIDESSTILYANESVERVFGYEPGELIGSDLTKVMPDRLQQAHYNALSDYVESGERTMNWNDIEIPGQHKEGHEVHLSVTFEEHPYENRRVFSGIIRDISERIERERQLERKNEQLEKFASIVSHDLRDPLNAAQARLSLAKAHAEGGEEYIREVEEIHDRMGRLIDDVLTLTKEGRAVGETEHIALEPIARDAWQTAGTETASLEIDDPNHVEADPERMRTVFENLFGNAVRYAGEDAHVRVGQLDEGNGFFVSDDGPGIPAEKREDVFEYGYTDSENGTGFGLNIVKSIADAHGWNVEITESEADGARFEFRSPAIE
ncbi:sensor histidine kinase [Salarchaeum japonicum]|uniref:histidine kinase n=1 Tax=Salarchaeum japonicum TaxID=555573 RepID=A0AAV3SX18_9EURY|nr:PAS domain-containing sensor histidine kinase [Salarchaeum japonicum]